MGHVLSSSGVAVDPSKFELITDWPVPKSVKQVESFIGLANDYRRFIQGFFRRSAPMQELASKDTPFVSGDDQETASADLKQALTNPKFCSFPTIPATIFLRQML